VLVLSTNYLSRLQNTPLPICCSTPTILTNNKRENQESERARAQDGDNNQRHEIEVLVEEEVIVM